LSQLCSVFFGTISPPALDYCILLYNKIFTPYINCDKSDSISPRKEESFRMIIKLKRSSISSIPDQGNDLSGRPFIRYSMN